ncbi:J domain-containing protein [Paludisphaera rhizosphaerae]|uniref:J domain-containing protein n=1 Tax=Paludisphaera rhizosphaerae TaxID=2711216 RepID=UPI0013EC8550|nr:J domain-containing protein [Paludisphaera rhizosphaerae]
MIHHFPFDPRGVLGVSPTASQDEIHEAFREKSKKHHPDLGGDEWAFRMVARAYEVLKSTSEVAASGISTAQPWTPRPTTDSGSFFSQGRFPFGGGGGATTAEADTDVEAEPETEPAQAEPPGIFQTVEVELIWIRFEVAEAVGAPSDEGPTLSVCMVVSWPRRSLVTRSAEYAHLGDTLRHVIDTFNGVGQSSVLAARTRIEDGQFVGWLSFPDVVAAQAGFLALRDGLAAHDLTAHLQTRDEIIPSNWVG